MTPCFACGIVLQVAEFHLVVGFAFRPRLPAIILYLKEKGFEADPSANGTSEGSRLRRSDDECRRGGEGIPVSPPVFEVNPSTMKVAKFAHTNCGREPYRKEI